MNGVNSVPPEWLVKRMADFDAYLLRTDDRLLSPAHVLLKQIVVREHDEKVARREHLRAVP